MGIFEKLAPPNPNDSRGLGADFMAYLYLYGEGEVSRQLLTEIFGLDAADLADLDDIDTAQPADLAERYRWWETWAFALSALEKTVWLGVTTSVNFVANTSTHGLTIASKPITAGPSANKTALANDFIAAIAAETWDHARAPTYAVINGSNLDVFNTGGNLSVLENMTIVSHGRARYYSRAQAKTLLGLP